VQEAIAKADALIEAMNYIRSFRDRVVVVKLGGSVLDDEAAQRRLLHDVAFMSTVGMRVIIVHGGGKAITRAMNEAGLEPVWVQGRRYTDQRTLNIVSTCWCGRSTSRSASGSKGMAARRWACTRSAVAC